MGPVRIPYTHKNSLPYLALPETSLTQLLTQILVARLPILQVTKTWWNIFWDRKSWLVPSLYCKLVKGFACLRNTCCLFNSSQVMPNFSLHHFTAHLLNVVFTNKIDRFTVLDEIMFEYIFTITLFLLFIFVVCPISSHQYRSLRIV